MADAAALEACLRRLGQSHLFSDDADAEGKARLIAQLQTLDRNYPRGLEAYISTARMLLGQAQRGQNPLEGWVPAVPKNGYDLEPATDAYAAYEHLGLSVGDQLGFVVPAGGLGERLGFHGVKFALPAELSTGSVVLRVYVGYILALQQVVSDRLGRDVELPLAIMVSDDTAKGIRELLDQNDSFGMKPSQITILKQDTSTLYFATFLATVGVSVKHELAVNLVSVPRKAKEAIGAVAELTHTSGRKMVANVEYNQLEPLLLATGDAQGDVNEADGFSKFPGNINEIVIHLPRYLETLEVTAGQVEEFINPKYTDSSRSTFKSPTRLECMMQDFAKTVLPGHIVGWTRYPTEFGYFPCKNDILTAARLSAMGVPPHSASTAEMAVYAMHCSTLRRFGAAVEQGCESSFRGVTVQVRGREVQINELALDGALEIDVADGGSLVVESLTVHNRGWSFEELSDEEQAAADEVLAMRGFKSVKHETRSVRVAAGENLVINES